MYICECGKEFEKANSFNGHKSHCVVHQEAIGNLDKLKISEIARHTNAKKTYAKNHAKLIINKEEENKLNLSIWISEQHICEHCGKVMTEKFGSGRFCSRACANVRAHSDETKKKISTSIKSEHSNKRALEKNIAKYLLNPNVCCICGVELSYEHRNRKTCSYACKKVYLSNATLKAVQKNGGNLNPHPNKNCKTGTYKNIHYDSSWELAFIIYNLDHNINIKRNKDSFIYSYNGKKHKYYPDFIIDNVYYEIKNFSTAIVEAKCEQFPKDKILNILYKNDLKDMLNYCEQKYGKNFWLTVQ